MIAQWKTIYNQHKDKLSPNRKSGPQLLRYIEEKYQLIKLHGQPAQRAKRVVTESVLSNEHWLEKLPKGRQPAPVVFFIENAGEGEKLFTDPDFADLGVADVFVGIDLESGFYQVEGSCLLWDELCAFQGLDEHDLHNFFCVAQYILALERFDLPGSALP